MTLAKVDGKGRVTVPKAVRLRLGIEDDVNITVEEGAVIIKPARDPYNEMNGLITKGVDDIAAKVRELREIAEKEAFKAVKERWR